MHVGATLPDELTNDTVFSTPRTDPLSESNNPSNRNSYGLKETEKSKVYLKEIQNNIPEAKVEYSGTVTKGSNVKKESKFPLNGGNSEFLLDMKPASNFGEKRRMASISTTVGDKENQKYY